MTKSALKSAFVLAGLISVLVIAPEPTSAWAAPAEENYRLYCVQCHGTLGNGEGINQTSGGLTVSPRHHPYAQQLRQATPAPLRRADTGGG